MPAFHDHYFSARDGLKLYYREYEGAPQKLPVLCLPGLTRNSRDFDALSQHIAPRRSVIAPDQRGRGRSQYDPTWLNYHPGTYIEDMWTLLRHLSIERVVVIGTSLGGVMAMLMASLRPQAIGGIVLNDIGPELDPAGTRRIQSYVGKLPPVNSWDDAVAQMKLMFAAALPDFNDERWRVFAANSFVEDEHGVPRLASDPKIGELARAVPAAAAPTIWPAFAALKDIPVLAIRGALSDLLAEATFDRMQREKPDLVRVTIANRGHTPLLDEPESLAAIDAFLGRIE
ncbi:MAG TPA: alpha/beta hydrolase [Steroidobacteraceae bacterium]|jgi:pimeloyl-ACP methyl ester carboxylesterase